MLKCYVPTCGVPATRVIEASKTTILYSCDDHQTCYVPGCSVDATRVLEGTCFCVSHAISWHNSEQRSALHASLEVYGPSAIKVALEWWRDTEAIGQPDSLFHP